jgi:deoxyribose-phosphate aldolase
MEFNKIFDHTLLKQDATESQIKQLCLEAKQYDFASVCVNPDFVSLAHKELEGSSVKVCTVIGFPLGANKTAIKVAEAIEAINDGAEEIDMVQNVSWVKEGRYDLVEKEIAEVKKACGDLTLKVILETCLLSEDEIRLSSLSALRGKADFVKTSTGFSKGGARVEDVKIMRQAVGDKAGVKASGGIHHLDEVKALIEAGANRIGASASVTIMEEMAKIA